MSESTWKKIGNVLIDKGLPLLGAAVAGPAGATFGSVIAGTIGSKSSNAEDILNQIIHGSGDTMIKLRELEQNHKEKLIELQLKESELFLADRQSARNREIEIVKATGQKDYNLYALAWLVILGYVGLTAVITYVDIPEANSQAAFMLYGGLVSGFSMVLGYFFGSSRGSSEKNQIMERLQTQIQAFSKPRG